MVKIGLVINSGVKMVWLKSDKLQTRAEEIGNATTHGLGALLSIVAIILFVVYTKNQNDYFKLVSSLIFGSTLLLMYLSSTLYHFISEPQLKQWFRVLDHSSIYLLIAGSYTPFMLVTIRGPWGWTLLTVVWSIAVAGVIFKLFFINRFSFASTMIYLVMGWLAVVAIKPICQNLSVEGLSFVVAGGLCYTIGVVFYLWKRLKFSHTLWHLFVLAGSICHFFAVFLYVVNQ